MDFKSLLTDFKTRVESNIQEALRPIDGITAPVGSDPESDVLRRRIMDLTEEGEALARKLAATEEKLRDKSRQLDALQPEIFQADLAQKDQQISDLQSRLTSLGQEYTNYRGQKETEISDLHSAMSRRDAEIQALSVKFAKSTEIEDARNFEPSDWQRRYETALQAIGELEEKLEETQEEISVLREELKRKFS